MPFVGIGVGIGRQRFASGIFAAYAARVAADGGVTEAGACVNAVSGISLNSSLLLVPSGYKSGVVYSQIPTNGDGDLTFTRASDATRVNSDGEIEVVGSGVPRLDYSQGSCPALLLEPQRTNLQTQSNGFLSNWTKNEVNTSVGESTLISGETTILMTETATNAVHRVVSVSLVSLTIGSVYTISFYAKSNGTRNIGLRTGFTGSSANIIFNPNTQTAVSVPAGFTTNITAANDGYYRYSITATAGAASDLISVVMFDGTALVYTGTTESIYISAIQTELGSYATSYIPTTSASVTRLADTFTRNNIYTNGLISASGGTWYIELKNNVSYTRDAGTEGLFIGDTSIGTTNCLQIISPIGGGRLRINKRIASVGASLYNTLTDNVKIAIKWNGTTADVFVNGVKVVSATAFTTTNMEFLNGLSDDVPKFIQAMALFNTPLSDSDCITLTT